MVSFVAPSGMRVWKDTNGGCYAGNETQNAPDFHSEMENRLKMNW